MPKSFFLTCIAALMALAAEAQNLDATLISEFQYGAVGHYNLMNQLRLDAELPVPTGGALQASTISMYGTADAVASDWQVYSNIQEDDCLVALPVLGYGHEWDNLSLFAGVHNLNEEFFVSDVTSFFLNSSFGIFPTVAVNYPVGNYPLSAMTLYFDVRLGSFNVRNSLSNGVARNGWTSDDNPFLIRPKTDGLANVTEVSYHRPGTDAFLGIASHTKQPDAVKASAAWYVYVEQDLWSQADSRLQLLAQYSQTTTKALDCTAYMALGLLYSHSPQTQLGVVYNHAHYAEGKEFMVECTFSHKPTEWLELKPSFQYINDPADTHQVFMARAVLCF